MGSSPANIYGDLPFMGAWHCPTSPLVLAFRCIQSVGAIHPCSGAREQLPDQCPWAPEPLTRCPLATSSWSNALWRGDEVAGGGWVGGWDLAEKGKGPWSASGPQGESKTLAWSCSERHSEFDLGISGKSHGCIRFTAGVRTVLGMLRADKYSNF